VTRLAGDARSLRWRAREWTALAVLASGTAWSAGLTAGMIIGPHIRVRVSAVGEMAPTGKANYEPANDAPGWRELETVASWAGFSVHTTTDVSVPQCPHQECGNQFSSADSITVGRTDYAAREIWVSLARPAAEASQVLAHEVAHVVDTALEFTANGPAALSADITAAQYATTEIKVDTAATGVMRMFGVDTSGITANYAGQMVGMGFLDDVGVYAAVEEGVGLYRFMRSGIRRAARQTGTALVA
jgi:hypothetical protein